jgi:hypothetical protein
MRLILLTVFAVSLTYAQPAAKVALPPGAAATTASPTPIVDPAERLKIFDLFAEGQKLQDKGQEINTSIAETPLGKERAELLKQSSAIQEKLNGINAKIVETPLGKELVEIDKQMNDLRKRYADATVPILASHGCAGGAITQGLELKGCAAPSPVKVPEVDGKK